MAETCRHRQTNKLQSVDSRVLMDPPTLICVKPNGNDEPEDLLYLEAAGLLQNPGYQTNYMRSYTR
jgi:hypothetical protein